MNSTGNEPITSVETMWATLRDKYDRVGQLADEAMAQFREDESADENLAAMEELALEVAALQQRLVSSLAGAPSAGEGFNEARKALAGSVARILAATGEAALSLRRLGGQIDDEIQSRKGHLAYQKNNL